MKQVVQDIRTGTTTVRVLPDPVAAPQHVVIANRASLVSAGTERYVVELARKSLVGKARQRPDHVRRVLQKVKNEGLLATFSQVNAKLDEPMPLGYSSAGVVLECGRGVQAFKPGDRVASAGPHAGVVSIGHNLVAAIPDGVPFDAAAYAAVAAIALQGVRLARVTLGERVLVIGLGLIGQITVSLLKAQGCVVIGTDIDPQKADLARSMGADATAVGSAADVVWNWTAGHGADAVIITAATASNEPIEFAAESCRVKGRIVLVGMAGLQVPRAPFFKKELEFTVSSSLGPGRWLTSYEEKGADLPVGYVRWTAQRNMQTVLELMASGRLPVEKLTTHTFTIDRAGEAYDLITSGKGKPLGIVIEYEQEEAGRPKRKVSLSSARPRREDIGISLIGAGNYARLVMLPALRHLKDVSFQGICSARGMNAEASGRRFEFRYATSDVEEVLADVSTDAVFIATRHDLHAQLAVLALKAGKNVFLEKPLCISHEELEQLRSTVEELGEDCPVLMVGFNRRFAEATELLRGHFRGALPLSIAYRMAPGGIPADHWTQDEEIGGGRLVGEACHAIDYCIAVTGSPPGEVHAASVGGSPGLDITTDRAFITLRHEDGSVSSISYQAGGDRAFPSERVEVFGGGRTAVLENWKTVDTWEGGRVKRHKTGHDKGHASGFAAFINACRTGGHWPIPWEDLERGAWASLAALESIRAGVPFRFGDSTRPDDELSL